MKKETNLFCRTESFHTNNGNILVKVKQPSLTKPKFYIFWTYVLEQASNLNIVVLKTLLMVFTIL